MKRKTLNIKSLISVVIIVMLLFSTVCFASPDFNKDETVYGMLDEKGSVEELKVVNRIFDIKSKEIKDNGEYIKLTAMCNAGLKELTKKYVVWEVEDKNVDTLYYQGVIKRQLPININIKYYLNDKEIKPNELAGKEGKVKVSISIKDNPKCSKKHKGIYMTQVLASVNLDDTELVSAKGSTKTIVGNKMSLAFVVLPEDNEVIDIIVNTDKFEMESLDFVLIKYENSMPKKFGEYLNGLSSFTDGFEELNGGVKSLYNGNGLLKKGTNQLYKGIDEMAKNYKYMSSGLKDAFSGISKLVKGLNELAKSIKPVNSGFKEIKSSLSLLVQGNKSFELALEAIVTDKTIKEMAQQLVNSEDPQVKLFAQAVLMQQEGFNGLYEGIKQENEGLQKCSDSVSVLVDAQSMIADNIKQVDEGFTKIDTEAKPLTAGSESFAEALVKVADSAKLLDEKVGDMNTGLGELSKGHQEMLDGIKKLSTEIESITNSKEKDIYSFVNDVEKVNSVQFYIKAKPIVCEVVEEKNIEIQEEESSWYDNVIDRFVNLFN